MFGVVGQAWVAQAGTAFEGQPQHQVHALRRPQALQRLSQGLYRADAVLGSAVGSRNQHSGDLRVSAHLLLKQFEVQSARVKAALDRQLHIGQQRRAVGGRTAVL